MTSAAKTFSSAMRGFEQKKTRKAINTVRVLIVLFVRFTFEEGLVNSGEQGGRLERNVV